MLFEPKHRKKKSLTEKKLQMRMCFNFGHTQPHQKHFNDCFCYYYTTNVIENEIIHLPTAQIPTRMPSAFFLWNPIHVEKFYLVHTNHNCGWKSSMERHSYLRIECQILAQFLFYVTTIFQRPWVGICEFFLL